MGFLKILKYKRLLLVSAALLTTLILFSIAYIIPEPENEVRSVTVQEKDGVYNLKEINDWSHTAVTLGKVKEYYPNVYLMPDEIENAGAVSTEKYKKINAKFLTQRFIVEVPDNGDVYVLYFKVSGRHAIQIYVNGELTGQVGNPGKTKQETISGENNITCYASAKNGKMEIVLHSAQFYHYKSGATLAALSLQQISSEYTFELTGKIKGLLIMGALFCASILLFCMFLFKPRIKATLYFSIACFTMGVRECMQSQVWENFGFIPGNLSFMLEYLTVVLLTIFLTLYLGELLTGRLWRIIKYCVLTVSVIYGIFVLALDSIFYTSVLRYYQAALIFFIIWGVAGLFWNMRIPMWEQAVGLYGIAVFYFCAVSDILMYNGVFPFTYLNTSVSEEAMLIFVLAQTTSLFLMSSRIVLEAEAEQQRLLGEKEVLESVNRLKTEFLGNVSHELKTPLTVMSSYAQYSGKSLEEEEPDRKEIKKYMKLIESEAERLSLMVSQILDVTCIEEGRMSFSVSQYSLSELMDNMFNTYYPVFSKNGNRLILEQDEGLEIFCDSHRIIQVLVNLISNAVRHTRNGEIIIRTFSGPEGFVSIEVKDTGDGIEEEQIKHLFERYNVPAAKKKETSYDGRNTGTGLGLFICRHIVEEHGGTITAESEAGRGTAISFTLPVTKMF